MLRKILIIGLISISIINAQENNSRPHGSQYNLPELTRNNYLMGYLNENRTIF